MTNMVKISVITSEYEELKSYMARWPYFYEITESPLNEILCGAKVYYVKMDVGCTLDLDFLIKMKKYTKSIVNIIGNPEELP